MLAAALSCLGGQGTRAVAALVLIGIAVPALGALLKPYVTAAVFALLCISFLRVDPRALHAYLGRPAIVLSATAWSSLGLPLLVGLVGLGAGLDQRTPEVFLALMLQAAASPMMAAPAFAALMGLDATLVLVVLVATSALVPATAPVLVSAFTGGDLAIDPWALAAKLFAILAGAAIVGLVLRRIVGAAAIERHRQKIDGVNILVLFVFVAAVMENVAARLVAAPLATLALALLAFVVFFAILALTTVLFRPAGGERALALGLMASQRNMGLMLAGTGGHLPDLTWLYFALAQFPIYLSPQFLRPLAQRALRQSSASGRVKVE